DLTLTSLVKTILDQTSLHRLRLGSIEPQELSDELVELVCQSSRVCSHLHIPLQSGSDTVLKRMNRHYTGQDFYRCLQDIYERSPEISIGIDLIVGFPGETDEEHQQSVELIDRLPIHYLHVFPYSKRPGTAAEKMKDHVDPAIAKDRATRLRQLGELKKQEYIKNFDGKIVEVVVENRSEGGRCKGLSDEYVQVVFESDQPLAGQCVKVLIVDVDGDGLTGKLI
ncbi:MAG: radical SAM protein, partial [Deltaproteobacteria bacterium]|nr:radical SAM protein [Deltaproteobacteria bacterium]